jgi:two-component system sensor histidine kinase ChvG
MAQHTGKPGRKRAISPITRRILAVNVLALVVLVAGMLYLDEYRQGLIAAELAALQTQADLFAAALGEGAATTDATGGDILAAQVAQQMVRRVVEASPTRARLFNNDGELVADSQLLAGPGGRVEIEELPPPTEVKRKPFTTLLAFYDRAAKGLSTAEPLPVYEEKQRQSAGDYPEVIEALAGETAEIVRAVPNGGEILSVAVPVQHYKQVLAALMLTRDSREIDAAVLQVRLDILKVFAIALGITILLSIYLAGTIARPIRRLARAAERVRTDRSRVHTIPYLAHRRDEIGELAVSLREMTEALWLRMDAIERFAADVAHEIKNPLTSLRSAVETAGRIKDPERREKLMGIIHDDVHRLDRLISDISDASRLDAELMREQSEPVDIGEMLATLADITRTASTARDVRIRTELRDRRNLIVHGVEGRLVQVFQNLIANAVSFSPPNGTITLKARKHSANVVAEVVDEGPGISEGNETEIFNRFYSDRPQGEKFGTHSGLGLSISKQIVEAHGGKIYVETVRRENGDAAGARFVVRLPLG